MKVLFLGNSHTYFHDMPALFARFGKKTCGEKPHVTMLAYSYRDPTPARSLQMYRGAINKAILDANLGFTPRHEGDILRIVIPPLTEERRKELCKAHYTITTTSQAHVYMIWRVCTDNSHLWLLYHRFH